MPIINDNVNELTEAFTAELSSPSGAQLGASTATITIGDNDGKDILDGPFVHCHMYYNLLMKCHFLKLHLVVLH